jgi:hypothetical protein
MYGSRFGPPRSSGLGYWTVLELNCTVYLVQTHTAGGLRRPVANTIHHPSSWDCRASIYKSARLADIVREVVQGKYLCNVEFGIVDKMLNNV